MKSHIPLEIINEWCDLAHRKNMKEHKKMFWMARDVIEGLFVSKIMKKQIISFIQEKCKESEEKRILMERLL